VRASIKTPKDIRGFAGKGGNGVISATFSPYRKYSLPPIARAHGVGGTTRAGNRGT
jgi:hypothetical protein